MKNLLPLGAAVAVLLWMLSGVLMVDTGEVALIYRFGAIVRTEQAGLGLRLPWPLEQDQRIALTEVRRVEPGVHRLLTGDINLVRMDLVVQYAVKDPIGFVLALEEPEAVISRQVTGAATAVAASMDVDTFLTTGRSTLQQRVIETAQASLDALGLGVRLVAVDVRELVPPPAVVDAFNDVSSARGDRETLALAAEAYASKLLPDVRGHAAQQVEQARAQASELLATARGDVARYRSLLSAWQENPRAVEQELHGSLITDLAPHLELVAAPPGSEIMLPLHAAPLEH